MLFDLGSFDKRDHCHKDGDIWRVWDFVHECIYAIFAVFQHNQSGECTVIILSPSHVCIMYSKRFLLASKK